MCVSATSERATQLQSDQIRFESMLNKAEHQSTFNSQLKKGKEIHFNAFGFGQNQNPEGQQQLY